MGFFEGLSFLSGGINTWNTLLNNRAQEKMQKKNYNNQIELWKMQNEYNKPINQMERLKEAGLNPNLVYGGGATTTAGPVGYTPGVAPQSPLSGVGDAINNYMNYYGQREERLLRKQAIDNAKEKDDAVVEIAKAEAGIKKEELEQQKLNNIVTRSNILHNMDINTTKIINDTEAHNLDMEIKRNEEEFNKKTRWLKFIVDSGAKIGDTFSKYVMPRFIFKK